MPGPWGQAARRQGPRPNWISFVMARVGVVNLFLLSVLNQGKEIILLWKNFYPPLNSPVIPVEQKFALPFTNQDRCLPFLGLKQLLSALPREGAVIQGLTEGISLGNSKTCVGKPLHKDQKNSTWTSDMALTDSQQNPKKLPKESASWQCFHGAFPWSAGFLLSYSSQVTCKKSEPPS